MNRTTPLPMPRRRALDAWLTLDPRSAGLFRIALATALLAQLAQRAAVHSELWSRDGAVPSSLLPLSREMPYFPSIVTRLESHPAAVAASIAAAFGAYSLLLVGWRTRLMTVASLAAFSAVAHRNPWLMIGGDAVLGSLLLWATLLPLGERFALDAPPDRGERPAPVSLAVAGARIQIAVIYLATAWQKRGPTWWEDATALARVLGMTAFRQPGAAWLDGAPPEALAFLTRAALLVEWSLPFLILSPWGTTRCRRAALAAILVLHGSIAVVLNAGIFPVAMLAVTPLLLSKNDWDAATRLARRVQRPPGADAASHSSNPRTAVTKNPRTQWLVEAGAALLLTGLAIDNWNRNFAPERRIAADEILLPWRIAAAPQRWEMFAPDPPRYDSHVWVEARARDGSATVLWTNQGGFDGAPSSIARRQGFLWKLFMERAAVLSAADRDREGEALRREICRFFAQDAINAGRVAAPDLDSVVIRIALAPTDPRPTAGFSTSIVSP